LGNLYRTGLDHATVARSDGPLGSREPVPAPGGRLSGGAPAGL